LAEYRRFVAYVYEYQKEKKGSNCGFVKIEVRGEICRIELHLQCPGLMPEFTCSVYGFVRNRGLLDGILLGDCVTGEGKVECILEISAGNMGDSGKSLDEMGGMIFVTEQGGFFGTEWDDQMIRPGNFRVVEKKMIPETQPDLSETERSSEEEIAESKTEAPEQDRDDRTEQAENVQKEETTQQELHSQSVQESDASDLVSEEMLHEHDKPHPSCPLPGTPCDAFSDGELSDCRKICVILGEGPVCFEIIASYSMALIISDIFFCAEINVARWFLASLGRMINRSASWQICLAFHISKKADIFRSREAQVDIGIV